MKQPRTFARYGSLPKPNGRTQTIRTLLDQAKARGEPAPTAEWLAGFLAISRARVERHLKILEK